MRSRDVTGVREIANNAGIEIRQRERERGGGKRMKASESSPRTDLTDYTAEPTTPGI